MIPDGHFRLIGPIALKSIIADLVARFERSEDVAVQTTFDLNPRVAQRILAGSPIDVGITNPCYVAELIDKGKVDAGSHAAFARVPLAVAAPTGRAGAIRSSAEDIRALLLQAESIAYTSEGTSGKTFVELASRLGILRQILPRTKPMAPGLPVRAVSDGEADLAVAPLTTVIAAPGVDCAAICPPELQADIDMSIFLGRECADRAAARRLVRYLSAASLDPYLESRGVRRFSLPQERSG